MTIAVIGIGLIGGSLVVDLRKRGFADRIIGVDNNMHHQNIALLCGLVDENDTLENAIDKSDLIILTTPVNTNCSMLPGILDRIAGTSKVVTDMGSTKASIADSFKKSSCQRAVCCCSSYGRNRIFRSACRSRKAF